MEFGITNILIIVIGILVCFTAIIFKRFFDAILGFVWGVSVSYIVMILMALSGMSQIRNMQDATAVIVLILVGVIAAIATVLLERLFITIHSVIISFFILFLLIGLSFQDAELSVIIVITLIGAVIIGMVMWKYHKYAFIIETAITGSIMINHMWLISYNSNLYIVRNSESNINAGVIILTIIIAIAGVVVQSNILRRMENNIVSFHLENNSGGDNLFSPDELKKDILARILDSAIVRDMTSEMIWLLIALLGFVVFPILDFHSYKFSYPISNWIVQICDILEMVAYGGIIYFVFNKKAICGFLYCFPAIIVRIYTEWIKWPITTASTTVLIAGPAVMFLMCLLLKKIIKSNYKYFCSILLVIFYKCFLQSWVANKKILWPVMKSYCLPIVCMVIVLTIIIKVKRNINIFDKYIVAIIVVVAVGFGVYKYIDYKQIYNNSALGQYYQSDSDIIANSTNNPNDNNAKAENNTVAEKNYSTEQLSLLTDEIWEVYDTVDYFTGERIYVMSVLGESLRYNNKLTFDEMGNFEIALGSQYNFSGEFKFKGDNIVLYSDSTSEMISMEYGTYIAWNGMETNALIWDYESESVGRCIVYFVNPSFYEG